MLRSLGVVFIGVLLSSCSIWIEQDPRVTVQTVDGDGNPRNAYNVVWYDAITDQERMLDCLSSACTECLDDPCSKWTIASDTSGEIELSSVASTGVPQHGQSCTTTLQGSVTVDLKAGRSKLVQLQVDEERTLCVLKEEPNR